MNEITFLEYSWNVPKRNRNFFSKRVQSEPFLLLVEDSKSKFELGGILGVFGARIGYAMHRRYNRNVFDDHEPQ